MNDDTYKRIVIGLIILGISFLAIGIGYIIYRFTRKRWKCIETGCKFDSVHGNFKSEQACNDSPCN